MEGIGRISDFIFLPPRPLPLIFSGFLVVSIAVTFQMANAGFGSKLNGSAKNANFPGKSNEIYGIPTRTKR
jgi:hypothetical protein